MHYFVSSFIKSNFVLIVFFCILVLLPWRWQLPGAWGLTQSFFYTKPCPSPNVPIENIWAINYHQSEVGWDGDHRPQLPEALHQEDMEGTWLDGDKAFFLLNHFFVITFKGRFYQHQTIAGSGRFLVFSLFLSKYGNIFKHYYWIKNKKIPIYNKIILTWN